MHSEAYSMKLSCFIICITGCLTLNSQTTIIDSIISGGQYRDYRLYVPTAYTGDEAVPLLLNLHGYSSDNFGQSLYANFNPIADTAGFITVLPNGTFDGFGLRFWNCFVAPGIGVDDVAFLSDLIDSISAMYNIDPQRIYSTGMSNGGFMSYALACELSERIAAIASVTGTIDKDRLSYCAPTHQVPVMHIHGTNDPTVPYGDNATFFSVDSVIHYWTAFNHTDEIADFIAVPDVVTTDLCTAEHYIYDNGWAGSRVEHFKIIGGEHTWPGTAITFLGITNQDINACKEIWLFLSQYRLNELTTISPATPDINLNTYPNPASTQLTIQTEIPQPVVTISDAAGNTIYRHQYTDNSTIQIPVADWVKGIYVVRIEGDGIVGISKVVIQ